MRHSKKHNKFRFLLFIILINLVFVNINVIAQNTIHNSDKFYIPPRSGMWWNPANNGSGYNFYYAGDAMYLLWFTYDQNNEPVWYLSSAESAQGTHWEALLISVQQNPTDLSLNSHESGTIQIDFSDPEHASLSWELDGFGMGTELIEYVAVDDRVQNLNRTGHWFDLEQDGYGIAIHEEGNTIVNVAYFYDDIGQPRWAIGHMESTQSTMPMEIVMGTCPGCDSFENIALAAGQMTIEPSVNRISTQINYPISASGGWISNVKVWQKLNNTPQTGLTHIAHIAADLSEPGISDWKKDHYWALNSQVPTKNNLFVFIPGSFAKPEISQRILITAADLGYHAVGVYYPNEWPLSPSCNNSTDSDCHRKLRQELMFGNGQTDIVEISETDSFVNRLTTLVIYLDKNFPQQNWAQFLNSEQKLIWNKLILSGGSQGGGHAAFIAQQFEVKRVVMISASADTVNKLGVPGLWMSDPFVTPIERFYGYSHTGDSGHPRHQSGWSQIGLNQFGGIANADNGDYQNSHQLSTSLAPTVAGKEHGSTGSDRYSPTDSWGRSLHRPAWEYLFDVQGP